MIFHPCFTDIGCHKHHVILLIKLNQLTAKQLPKGKEIIGSTTRNFKYNKNGCIECFVDINTKIDHQQYKTKNKKDQFMT